MFKPHHDARKQTISIGLIGTGLIGRAFLKQIDFIKKQKIEPHTNLCVRGIMNSKTMLLSEESIIPHLWEQSLSQSNVTSDLNLFSKHLLHDAPSKTIILDCTADRTISEKYIHFFKQGIHVVTPNKQANSGDLDFYKRIKQEAIHNKVQYRYEATVGAGLPIIRTLQDLITTGDTITRIEGVFSGTLHYIFNQLEKEIPFSEVVTHAKQKGYTEPDPRQDLSGMDVARKLICLAREAGYLTGINDVSVQNLVPAELQSCSIDDFFQLLPNYDEKMRQRVMEAQSKNETLRYVGEIDTTGKINISTRSIPIDHHYATLPDKNNMIMFHSKLYDQEPLIIQGPVLGEKLNVSAMLSDLMHIIAL